MTAVVPAVDALDRRFEAVVVAGARLGTGVEAAAARSSLPVVLVPAAAHAVASALDALRDGGVDRQDAVVLDTSGALDDGRDGVTVVRVDDARAVVDEQLLRRSRGELPLVDPPATWRYDVLGVDPEHERVAGALLAVGDGVVGVTGAPLAGDGAVPAPRSSQASTTARTRAPTCSARRWPCRSTSTGRRPRRSGASST